MKFNMYIIDLGEGVELPVRSRSILLGRFRIIEDTELLLW